MNASYATVSALLILAIRFANKKFSGHPNLELLVETIINEAQDFCDDCENVYKEDPTTQAKSYVYACMEQVG